VVPAAHVSRVRQCASLCRPQPGQACVCSSCIMTAAARARQGWCEQSRSMPPESLQHVRAIATPTRPCAARTNGSESMCDDCVGRARVLSLLFSAAAVGSMVCCMGIRCSLPGRAPLPAAAMLGMSDQSAASKSGGRPGRPRLRVSATSAFQSGTLLLDEMTEMPSKHVSAATCLLGIASTLAFNNNASFTVWPACACAAVRHCCLGTDPCAWRAARLPTSRQASHASARIPPTAPGLSKRSCARGSMRRCTTRARSADGQGRPQDQQWLQVPAGAVRARLEPASNHCRPHGWPWPSGRSRSCRTAAHCTARAAACSGLAAQGSVPSQQCVAAGVRACASCTQRDAGVVAWSAQFIPSVQASVRCATYFKLVTQLAGGSSPTKCYFIT